MNYYLVKKDPEFQAKMHDVLVIYKQIEMCFDESGNLCIDMDAPKTVTISYDEKPGIQALLICLRQLDMVQLAVTTNTSG